MGWASGTDLMRSLINSIESVNIEPQHKLRIYRAMIHAFEDHDWDTQDEVLGISPVFDEAFNWMHPMWGRL